MPLITQLAIDLWPYELIAPVGILLAPPREISRRLEICFTNGTDDLGPYEASLLMLPSKSLVGLRAYPDSQVKNTEVRASAFPWRFTPAWAEFKSVMGLRAEDYVETELITGEGLSGWEPVWKRILQHRPDLGSPRGS